MNTQELVKYDVTQVLMEFERAIKHQCAPCLDRVLDVDDLGEDALGIFKNLPGIPESTGDRPRRAPHTSTWDFDLSIVDITVDSDERAVATVNCLFYRNITLGKHRKCSTRSGNPQTVGLKRTESGWRISDLSAILPVLTREIATGEDKAIESLPRDKHLPF
jgi:hypothetical protein